MIAPSKWFILYPIHNSPNDQIYFHDLIIQYSELCGVAALIDMVVYKKKYGSILDCPTPGWPNTNSFSMSNIYCVFL